MKKIIALMLSATLFFALTACQGAQAERGEFNPDDPATLVVWMDNDDWAEAVIEAFTAHHPHVEVIYQHMGNVDARDRVSLDGPAGIGPDVFLFPHDHLATAIMDGLIEPIPLEYQELHTTELISTAVYTVSMDGEMYGVPISIENIALFWNIDLYGEEPPETFEEILEFAREYNDPATGQWALTWQVADAYHNFHWLSAFGMQIFGPNRNDFRNIGLDSPQAAVGLEHYRLMREAFDVPVSEASWDNTVARFQRGESPFTISGPWAIADARNNGVNFGVTKLPTIAGNQPWCFSGLIIACVSSYSENIEWANKFVAFLASEEGAAIQYDITGKMTTRSEISGIPGLSEDIHLMGIAEQAPYSIPMPIIPEVHQMWGALGPLFEFVWNGDLSIEDAQEVAMNTYITLLAAAGKSLDGGPIVLPAAVIEWELTDEGMFVYYYNSDEWLMVSIYTWEPNEQFGSWPGKPVEDMGDGWWRAYLSVHEAGNHIIWNNMGAGYQTENIVLEDGVLYFYGEGGALTYEEAVEKFGSVPSE